jgi:Zn finger protein HypA/HybF involved in hydrogenase expression
MKRDDILEKATKIKQWIAEHRSKAFICRQLHCKPVTLDSYLTKLGIVYKGNQGGQGRKSSQRKPAVSYLYKGSKINAHDLRLKLIRDGIKQAQCESCYLSTWFNNSIPLELHHINGDRFDNRLENLQILCPNCHALTDNHAGKSHKISQQSFNYQEIEQLVDENKIHNQPVSVLIFDSPESYERWQDTHPELKQLVSKGHTSFNTPLKQASCLYCGRALTKLWQDAYCSTKCSRLAVRKVERPSKKELQQLIWEIPTIHIAKKFGVSDKAIGKWCKAYGIDKPPRGYWTKLNKK